ncbi:MAG TPA: cation:proton antiporter [Tepidisphaeraceae bacterium]|nr:cation:proton antiporter [Tepidisphaeraceae bacterium]
MSKTTSFYFGVALIFGAAIWLILALGRNISHAPPDIAGTWTIDSNSSFRVGQSGGHIQLSFRGGQPPAPTSGSISLTLYDLRNVASGVQMGFGGGPWTFTAVGHPGQEAWQFDLSNHGHWHFAATRTLAAYQPLASAARIDPILLLMAQLALILGLCRVMGFLCNRIRQPQVMGEMIAGIMLGPSLLGLLWPHAFSVLFPPDSTVPLNTLSQIGVIFFLFLIGLELDPKLLRNRGESAVLISHCSILAPFLLGAGLMLYLYPRLFDATSSMNFISVALFMGASMSITAFPVLARILTERNLQKTKVGAIAITCAAVDDVTAWCILAFVVAVARATGLHSALLTALLALIYVTAMFFLIRPFLRRLELVYDRAGTLSHGVMAIIFLLTLASAYATEWIGIHALFGAFLMGAIMPKGTLFVRTITERLEDFCVIFLLPVFFAYTGLRTQIGILNHPALWFYTGLIVLAACAGKFGGSALAGRFTGLSWREASAVGILMNTRGLMELVILNIGHDLGVITDAVFAMMVIMAIVTTALTTPILYLVHPQAAEGLAAPPEAEAEKLKRRRFTVLIPVSLPSSGPALLSMANVLSPAADLPRKIIALNLHRPVDRDAYRSGLQEADRKSATFKPLLEEAARLQLNVETFSFASRDVPSDIARVARVRQADLILMGFHKPVFGQAILGGTVHRVLTGSDCDVAIFVDRQVEPARRLLVPYMGGRHDRMALDLAGRIARNSGAELTVLHVITPGRRAGDATINARGAVEKAYADPTQPTPVHFVVIEDPSPVDAVIQRGKDFGLVVIGVEEEWGMASHLFGWRPERIARECPSSLLIVRKHGGQDMERDRSLGQQPAKSQSADPAAANAS